MPSNSLILCHPLLLLPSVFPSIRVFSNKSVLHIRWPKYWSFSFSISPSNEYSGQISFRMDWLDLLAVQGLSRVLSNTTVQKYRFFGAQLSLQPNSHIHTCHKEQVFFPVRQSSACICSSPAERSSVTSGALLWNAWALSKAAALMSSPAVSAGHVGLD